jgi:hypothetical protein
MELSSGPNHSSLSFYTAAMTSDTRKKRTKRNARVAKRKILLASEISWTSPFQLTPESSASNRKRRKPVKRSAKTSLAGRLQRRRSRKRSAVQKRKLRQRKKRRRSICCTVQSVLVSLTVYVGCESRGKEGEGCSC